MKIKKNMVEDAISDLQKSSTYYLNRDYSVNQWILVCSEISGMENYNRNGNFLQDSIKLYSSSGEKTIITEGKHSTIGINGYYKSYVFINADLFAIRELVYCVNCNPHYQITYHFFHENTIVGTVFSRAGKPDTIIESKINEPVNIHAHAINIYEFYNMLSKVDCE